MMLGGNVYVEGPNLRKRLKDDGKIRLEYDGMEFILEVSDSSRERVRMEPWIRLYGEDILIQNQINDVSSLFERGEFSLCVTDSKNQNLEIIFSVDQIRVIKDLFDQCLTAHEAHRRLEEDYSVKARAEAQ